MQMRTFLSIIASRLFNKLKAFTGYCFYVKDTAKREKIHYTIYQKCQRFDIFSKKKLCNPAGLCYITINKQLDDEENHRLAIESDYNDLIERINNIDENTCKFNKKDINDFCDNMLDFFKNHQL